MNNTVWNSVLAEIEISVSRASFMTWFKNTSLIEDESDQVTVSVPNIFAKQQLEVKYNDTIKELLQKNGVNASKVVYAINPESSKRRAKIGSAVEPAHSPATSTISAPKKAIVNDRYTFENFIVGSGNELAYAAGQAIASNPGTKYNPLFIYGGVGLGKTHLMHAVANKLLSENPRAKVLYLTSEKFTNDYINAISTKKMEDFNKKFEENVEKTSYDFAYQMKEFDQRIAALKFKMKKNGHYQGS